MNQASGFRRSSVPRQPDLKLRLMNPKTVFVTGQQHLLCPERQGQTAQCSCTRRIVGFNDVIQPCAMAVRLCRSGLCVCRLAPAIITLQCRLPQKEYIRMTADPGTTPSAYKAGGSGAASAPAAAVPGGKPASSTTPLETSRPNPTTKSASKRQGCCGIC